MSHSSQPTHESHAILLADALKKAPDQDLEATFEEPVQQLVLFRLNEQRFALPGEAVSEILRGDQPVYYVPGLPASTEGVLHLRGAIESLIHLQPLLGMPLHQASGMILMVEAAGIRSGVRIDQLDDVCDVVESALLPPPGTLSSALQPYVSALWQIDDGDVVALLNADALLAAYQQGLG